MNGFPLERVYVNISSDIVKVTNQTVDFEMAEEEKNES